MPSLDPVQHAQELAQALEQEERKHQHTRERARRFEVENATLRQLLAAAERLITAHHAAGMRRKGEVCPYCQREHETVNQIWRTLHQP